MAHPARPARAAPLVGGTLKHFFRQIAENVARLQAQSEVVLGASSPFSAGMQQAVGWFDGLRGVMYAKRGGWWRNLAPPGGEAVDSPAGPEAILPLSNSPVCFLITFSFLLPCIGLLISQLISLFSTHFAGGSHDDLTPLPPTLSLHAD